MNLQRAIFAREARGTDTILDFNFTTPLAYPYLDLAARAPGKNGELFYRKDAVLDRGEFEEMKREFYQLRGWDPATGLQTKTKLEELELGDVAEELVKRRLAV